MPRTATILVADDESSVRTGLQRILRSAGHSVLTAASGDDARRAAREGRPDLVLLDVDMPGGSGLEALSAIASLADPPGVVMMSGVADVPTAVAAMKDGAMDFLEKPVRYEMLEAVIARVLGNRAVRRERDRLRGELAELRAGAWIGSSGALRQVLDQVRRVASTPRTTVLVTGESGVGKELVARAIHESSARSDGPFVALNCAALTDTLLEAELFGYEPGAFTGAARGGREGLLAAAEGGTLFLDEIGELDPGLQAKLLRVLQERVYRRVGSNDDVAMDARIVASTNRDLQAMVEAGAFREDLFYRLNVMSIRVPPLRERIEDVPELARHFLEQFAREFARPVQRLREEALDRLCAHPWTGNVRELRNAIERAVLLAEGTEIDADHLELARGASPAPVDHDECLPLGDRSVRGMEERLIRRVLEEAGGNRSQAARVLGMNRTTLYNKIRRLEIRVLKSRATSPDPS